MKESLVLHKELIVPGSISSLTEVESFVDDFCLVFGVSEEIYANVLISVTEAFTNAVDHGSSNNQKVFLSVYNDSTQFIVNIKDGGSGFDFESLPDPTSPENIEDLNGRGIFLMKNLADDVKFLDNGSRVELSFNL